MRVSSGPARKQKLKKIRKKVKGYYSQRGRQLVTAKEAILKAGESSYKGRKQKKRDYRSLWTIRINAALIPYDMNYSTFIKELKAHNIKLNRKVLSELAINEPEAFKKVVETVSAGSKKS